MTHVKNSAYSQKGKARCEILVGSIMFWPWMYKPLVSWDDSIFKLPHEHHASKEIKVSSIVGSTHPDYNSLASWIEFLGALKKVESSEALLYYSQFFKESKKIEDGSLLGYKGNYWIAGGNNRICIARFMNIESIVAPVTEYQSH